VAASTQGWTDLLDPSEEELRRHAPAALHPRAVAELLAPSRTPREVRPVIEGHGDYVFGLLLPAIAVPEQDRVYYQEVAFVLAREHVLTVRKTPVTGEPFDFDPLRAVFAAHRELPPGKVAYHLADDVAESYFDLLDALGDEIDELEEHVEDWKPTVIQKRLAALRHDLLDIRRVVAPMRDAIRGVVDGRTDLEGRAVFRREVFPRDVELYFASVYDKLLRATESLDFARDLLVAVRELHQTKLANEQNRVVKTLTVIASLVLFPTFIVGVYGQNFDHMPELHWRLGYLFSWGLIVGSTLVQLAFFRWRRWI
jgi:magnesium transporter